MQAMIDCSMAIHLSQKKLQLVTESLNRFLFIHENHQIQISQTKLS